MPKLLFRPTRRDLLLAVLGATTVVLFGHLYSNPLGSDIVTRTVPHSTSQTSQTSSGWSGGNKKYSKAWDDDDEVVPPAPVPIIPNHGGELCLFYFFLTSLVRLRLQGERVLSSRACCIYSIIALPTNHAILMGSARPAEILHGYRVLKLA